MWKFPSGQRSKTLSEVLERGSNNFDLLRLLAATAVIYGHSFSLHGGSTGLNDLLFMATGIHSAEWGVKTFFFLSGLLVVNSVISDGNALHYGIKRLFRIWPALIFVILVSVFLIGPAFTTQSLSEYFSSPSTWEFLRRMTTFRIWGYNSMSLPGVFEANPYPAVVNAPLWTLSVEVYAYVMIFVLFAIGALRKETATVVFGLFLIDSLLPDKVIFYWLPNDHSDFAAIPFCFALGGLLAVFKDQVKVNLPLIIVVALLAQLLGEGVHEYYLKYTTMFLLALFLSAIPIVTRLPRLPDISYGTYLWGWPIQQAVMHLFEGISFWANLALTLSLVYLAAIISWYLVEKRFLKLGRTLVEFDKARISSKTAVA